MSSVKGHKVCKDRSVSGREMPYCRGAGHSYGQTQQHRTRRRKQNPDARSGGRLVAIVGTPGRMKSGDALF
jgi:hypothetical protein